MISYEIFVCLISVAVSGTNCTYKLTSMQNRAHIYVGTIEFGHRRNPIRSRRFARAGVLCVTCNFNLSFYLMRSKLWQLEQRVCTRCSCVYGCHEGQPYYLLLTDMKLWNRTIDCPHRTETITPNYVITVMKHKQNGKKTTHLVHMAVKFKFFIIMKIQYILW